MTTAVIHSLINGTEFLYHEALNFAMVKSDGRSFPLLYIRCAVGEHLTVLLILGITF